VDASSENLLKPPKSSHVVKKDEYKRELGEYDDDELSI